MPAKFAGLWEFPGSKVDNPADSEPAAVARDCYEELGISVADEYQLGRACDQRRLELTLNNVDKGSTSDSKHNQNSSDG
jgi:8-oxo-dGTP pyrophosphatase MutT (NUDIX family)